jgi:hypothetical protein
MMMENKMTAMQTLMEWMIEASQVIPVDPQYVYEKAEELLAKEKEQMIKYSKLTQMYGWVTIEDWEYMWGKIKELDNETYGN